MLIGFPLNVDVDMLTLSSLNVGTYVDMLCDHNGIESAIPAEKSIESPAEAKIFSGAFRAHLKTMFMLSHKMLVIKYI